MDNLKGAKRIVVKVGTSTLTYETGKANIRRIRKLVEVLSDLKNSGMQIVLVTSGAIGIGVGKLGLSAKPKDTPGRQAAATVGQCELMFMYDKLFAEFGHITGQLLVTKLDFENEERKNNLSNSFNKLFEYGAVPVVNENDAVAVDEIVFGDNDNLSAIVANLINADGLIILSDIDGLFSGNPKTDDNAVLIPVVEKITEEIETLAGGAGSNRGTGGMITKIHAAKVAGSAGIPTAIINGSNPEDIYRLIEGRQTGTFFRPESREE
ncbi:MAG: glutamate 5-kinase [Clostridia bacterium]|nr:glutamate 5-kinase [Clostridia bacterium]